ncbi:MAG: hypothetical protein AB4426_21650 [Xenococcaceae cyanobacterium]
MTKTKKRTKKRFVKADTPGDIRTDKWMLHPSTTQLLWLEYTIAEYRKFVRVLITMTYTHWVEISKLCAKDQVTFVERLFNYGNFNKTKSVKSSRRLELFPQVRLKSVKPISLSVIGYVNLSI